VSKPTRSCAARIAELAALPTMEIRRRIPLEDGRTFGGAADPWQIEDAAKFDDPRWRHHFRELPRGHDKTGSAGTEVVVDLLTAPARSEIYGFATGQEQADILLRDVSGKIERLGLVGPGGFRIRARSIVGPKGSTFTSMASDAPSAMGLRPHRMYLDELAEWPERAGRALWTSIRTAAAKGPGCRFIVATTAGVSKSSLCWEVRSAAERGPRWRFTNRQSCASWLDRDELEEQRRVLPSHVYQRLHEARWVDDVGRWLTFQQVDFCFTQPMPRGSGPRGLGIDVGVTRDRSAAGDLWDAAIDAERRAR
jgi:hypothetical protein